MKLIKRSMVWVVFLALFSTASFALDLSEAKKKGWVGEQVNGYLGLPQGNQGDAVTALMNDINAKRKAKYREIAAKVAKPLATVEQLAGEKAIAKTASGNYVQSSSGAWVKK